MFNDLVNRYQPQSQGQDFGDLVDRRRASPQQGSGVMDLAYRSPQMFQKLSDALAGNSLSGMADRMGQSIQRANDDPRMKDFIHYRNNPALTLSESLGSMADNIGLNGESVAGFAQRLGNLPTALSDAQGWRSAASNAMSGLSTLGKHMQPQRQDLAPNMPAEPAQMRRGDVAADESPQQIHYAMSKDNPDQGIQARIRAAFNPAQSRPQRSPDEQAALDRKFNPQMNGAFPGRSRPQYMLSRR